MPRKLSGTLISIMMPNDENILKRYEQTKAELAIARKANDEARKDYKNMISRLNAVIEPNEERVYEYIESLYEQPEFLRRTPRDEVYKHMCVSLQINSISQAKFGRMMNEMGIRRTSIRVNNKVQSRWRVADN